MVAKEKNLTIEISPVDQQSVTVSVVGVTPLLMNRLSEKARHGLILPPRKSSGKKPSGLKHDPIEEFQASPYRLRGDDAPTLLAGLSTWFKGAMRTAALDTEDTSKAEIGRLAYVEGDYIPIYGVPKLHMAIVRQAGINKTPDVRTRAILPKWAAQFTVTFISPKLNAHSVMNLIGRGGVCSGVGDWRPEKGGRFGQFRIANPDDAELQAILASGGKEAQEAAMASPAPYDDEVAELLSWFEVEVKRMGLK